MAETQCETLLQLAKGNVCAGLVLKGGKVTETAPILRFMKGWSGARVWDYCQRWNWQVVEVPAMKPETATGALTVAPTV